MWGARILISIVGFLLVIGAWGQEGGPPMYSDDARVADYKEWEINTSFNTVISRPSEFSIPHIDLNYGVYHDLQLKIEAPLIMTVAQGEKTVFGIGEIGAGFKYRFLDEEKYYISAATFPQYFFNGDNNGMLIPVFLERTFGKFLLGPGVGYFFGEQANNHIEIGSLVGYKPIEKLDLMLEYFHQRNIYKDPGNNGHLNLGFRVYLNDNFVIMGSFGTQVLTQIGNERERFVSWVGLRSLF